MNNASALESLVFLADTVIGFYAAALMLRFWMRFCHADYHHPLSQFIVRITNAPLQLSRRFVPDTGRVDAAVLLLLWIVEIIRVSAPVLLLGAAITNYAALLLLAAALALRSFVMLLIALIIVRALMSWFANPRDSFQRLLINLTEPLLAPVQRLLPAFGGIDLSPMLVVFLLWLMRRHVAQPLIKFAHDFGPFGWPVL